jgi:hypothetical protein
MRGTTLKRPHALWGAAPLAVVLFDLGRPPPAPPIRAITGPIAYALLALPDNLWGALTDSLDAKEPLTPDAAVAVPATGSGPKLAAAEAAALRA